MPSEECRCDCHRKRDGVEIRHMRPCCLKCHFCSTNIPISAVSEHNKRCAMSFFETELKYFEQHRMRWYQGYAGMFALIKGTTLHGFFDTYDRALSAGYLIHGLSLNEPAPFFIKEVQMRDRVIYMPDRIVIDLFKGIQKDYVR